MRRIRIAIARIAVDTELSRSSSCRSKVALHFSMTSRVRLLMVTLIDIPLAVKPALFYVRQNIDQPGAARIIARRGQESNRIVVMVNRDADLLEIILAL